MTHAGWPQEFILMALLVEQPDHGYGLFRRLQEDPAWGKIWRIQRSEVYFLLRKLSARRWVRPVHQEKAGGPTRWKVAPTTQGRRKLVEWIRTPVASPRELRAAFVAKLYLAIQHGPNSARELLRQQRMVLRRRLKQEADPSLRGPLADALGIRTAQSRAVLDYLGRLGTRWRSASRPRLRKTRKSS
jgi:DNA-binding PadR family transcriptional regulator